MAIYKNSYPFGSIVRSGLVLNLDATNLASYPGTGTTWFDTSGYGNSGSFVSGAYVQQQRGRNSVYFDGVDDYFLWNNLSAVKWQNWSSMTVECVFTLNSYTGSTGGRQYLVDFRDFGGIVGAVGLFYDSSVITPLGLKLFYNTTTGNFEEPLISTISLNTIYHYQVTFDKTTSTNNIKHYLNGTNVLNRSVAITANDIVTGRAYLGAYGGSGGGYLWNGNIYNFRFYNRALTAAEVQQNFNALRNRFGI